MNNIFLKILNMSIAGGITVLVVLLARLLLRKAPKWTRLLLWGIVGIRLALPFFVESPLSLMPRAAEIDLPSPAAYASVTESPAQASTPSKTADPVVPTAVINHPTKTSVPIVTPRPAGETASPAVTETPKATAAAIIGITDDNPAPPSNRTGEAVSWLKIAAFVWAGGAFLMLAYAVISYIILRRRLMTAVRFEGNVYEADGVKTPFLLGLFRPSVYLPFGMDERSREFVLMHENAHLKGLDHVLKPLGWALLAVHWFNPLVWVAFALFSKDIELACDERVIRGLGADDRADYSRTLLELSVNKRRIAACPLAFGEANIKERVKNVLNYKKPTLWIIIAAVIVTVFITGCFLTNPRKDKKALTFTTPAEAYALADENGWAAINENYHFEKGEDVWNDFCAKVNAKEAASVTVVHVEDASALNGGKGSEGLNILVTRIGYDGNIFTSASRPGSTEDFGSEREFKYLDHYTVLDKTAVRPEHIYHLYALMNEPLNADNRTIINTENTPDGVFRLVDDPSEAENSVYPLFMIEAEASDLSADPYAYAEEHGLIAVDIDGRFVCGKDVWEDFIENQKAGVPAEATVVTSVGTVLESVSDSVSFIIVLNNVVFDGEKYILKQSTQFPAEFGEEAEFTYLEEKRMTDGDAEYVNYYLTRKPLDELLVQETTIFEKEAQLLLSVRADEPDLSGPYNTFGYTPSEDSIIADWAFDLDGDGEDELFHADLGLIIKDSVSFAWVTDADGRLLGNMMFCGSGHTAFNTFAVVETDEFGTCIMRIAPEFYGQYYGYDLMKVVNGEFKTVYSYEYWNYDGTQSSYDPAEAQAYEDEVNAMLGSGYILITTDHDGVMWGDLRLLSTCGTPPDADEPLDLSPLDLAVVSSASSVGDGFDRIRAIYSKSIIFVTDWFIGYRFKCEPFTSASVDDSAAYIDDAWAFAEEVMELHDLVLLKETASASRVFDDSPGHDVLVTFTNEDDSACLNVCFEFDDELYEWTGSLGSCTLYVEPPESVDGGKLQRDINETAFEDFPFDGVQVGDNGLDPEENVAAYAARKAARALTDCSRDNYLRCDRAEVVTLEEKTRYVDDGFDGIRLYYCRLAIDPVNEWFSGVNAQIVGRLYASEEHPEYRGLYTIGMEIRVVRHPDGSFDVYYVFDDAMERGFLSGLAYYGDEEGQNYADLDGDGIMEQIVIRRGIERGFDAVATLSSNGATVCKNIPITGQWSGEAVNFDPNDGRTELVFCWDEESNDYITWVLRLNDTMTDFDVFTAPIYANPGPGSMTGFGDGYAFYPGLGLPCGMRTEILGACWAQGRFTVTANGIEFIGPFSYNYSTESMRLKKDITVFLPDANGGWTKDFTVRAGSRVRPMYTDMETFVMVRIEGGRLARISVSFGEPEYHMPVYLNGVDQDEYFDLRYAD